ncbi:hypothetical protein ACTA71_009371 [Dictyostelium dimigraforme]
MYSYNNNSNKNNSETSTSTFNLNNPTTVPISKSDDNEELEKFMPQKRENPYFTHGHDEELLMENNRPKKRRCSGHYITPHDVLFNTHIYNSDEVQYDSPDLFSKEPSSNFEGEEDNDEEEEEETRFQNCYTSEFECQNCYKSDIKKVNPFLFLFSNLQKNKKDKYPIY